MSEFNKRYDFDRAQEPKFNSERLRAILILLAVLIVTGVIIYLIIPHGEPKKDKKSETKTENTRPDTPPPANPPGATDDKTKENSTADAAPDRDRNANTSQQQSGGKTDEETGGNAAPTGTKSAWSSGTPAEGGVDDPMERAKEVVVQPGEDLGTIADRYHTTVEGIKHFNGLKDDRIKNGQTLKVIPGPWRITVQNGLILEHAPDGQWQLFRSFPADANGVRGEFVVSSRHSHPTWIDASGGQFKYGDPENPYGDYLLKLAKPKTPKNPLPGFGIHGVNDKTSNLKNCGRGCIHVSAGDIELLYYLICPGTKVTVIPGGAARNSEM